MSVESVTGSLATRWTEEPLTYRRSFRLGQFLLSAGLLLLVAIGFDVIVTSPNLRWNVVGSFLFDERILAGVGQTLFLTVVSMLLAVVVGIILALMRRSKNPVVQAVAWGYVNVVRSIPLLVLILIAYFLAVLLPTLSVGIPFGGPVFWAVDTNSVITPLTASILALGFGEGAYTSEIIRGGILAVDRGQHEAATALGMPNRLAMRRIVLPQAFRVIVPALGNETVNMLKGTSLVQVIGYAELLTTAQRIYAQNFETIPLLVVVTLWYLFLTTVGSLGQAWLEKRLSRGYSR